MKVRAVAAGKVRIVRASTQEGGSAVVEAVAAVVRRGQWDGDAEEGPGGQDDAGYGRHGAMC